MLPVLVVASFLSSTPAGQGSNAERHSPTTPVANAGVNAPAATSRAIGAGMRR